MASASWKTGFSSPGVDDSLLEDIGEERNEASWYGARDLVRSRPGKRTESCDIV